MLNQKLLETGLASQTTTNLSRRASVQILNYLEDSLWLEVCVMFFQGSFLSHHGTKKNAETMKLVDVIRLKVLKPNLALIYTLGNAQKKSKKDFNRF